MIGRVRAFDLHQHRRRIGSSDSSSLIRRHHHEPRPHDDPGDGEACPQGRLAVASGWTGYLPGSVRRIWWLLCEPLPQYGSRGLRLADAYPDAGRGTANDHADPEPDTRPRILPDAPTAAPRQS